MERHDQAAEDSAVAELYERYPYPPPLESLDALLRNQDVPLWNPRDSSALFFPEGRPERSLDILVAGCGTRMAPIYAALMPRARVVGIDIARSSLDAAHRLADQHGLSNLELIQLPIEQVDRLGRSFDIIHAFGVLHHLADPVAGLNHLGQVLNPEGVVAIMVYALHGRHGVYLLQSLARQLELKPDLVGIRSMKAIVKNLPIGHPLSLLPLGDRPDLVDEEVVDMLLHPRDVAYDVLGVRDLIAGAGLKLHRWLGLGQYMPSMSPLEKLGLAKRLSTRDPWSQASAMEAFYGNIWQHVFLVTRPDRASATELFSGNSLLDAIPFRSPHGIWWEEQGEAVISSVALQVPVSTRLPMEEAIEMLDACNGRFTVGRIAQELASHGRKPIDWYVGKIYELYAMEAVELSLVPDQAPRPKTRRTATPRPRPTFEPVQTAVAFTDSGPVRKG